MSEEKELGGTRWEHEHAVDFNDYLDALLDPDDPRHEAAIRDQPDTPEPDDDQPESEDSDE